MFTLHILYLGTAIVAILGGAILMVVVAGIQRKNRRSTEQDINATLQSLAAALDGEFIEGRFLYEHPVVGTLREYGTARVVWDGICVQVTVNYPSDDNDNCTSLRLPRPPGRKWRVPAFRMRRPPPVETNSYDESSFKRYFKVSSAHVLSPALRAELLRLGHEAFEFELREDEMYLTVAVPTPWVGGVLYVRDTARLQGVVKAMVHVAQGLLIS